MADKEQKSVTTWKMRTGEVVLIKDMSDSHIRNTVRFILRMRSSGSSSEHGRLNSTINAMMSELRKRKYPNNWVNIFRAF